MKLQISTLSVILLFTVFSMMISCTKEGNDETNHKSHQSYNVAKRINMPFKAGDTPGGGGGTVNPGGPIYDITFRTGHKKSICNGQCVRYGHVTHIDCQGLGNACSVSAVVGLNVNVALSYTSANSQNVFDAIGLNEDDLTSDDTFAFPPTSFLIDDSQSTKWLNIPSQMLYRDTETNLFIYHGLFYSNIPYFE